MSVCRSLSSWFPSSPALRSCFCSVGSSAHMDSVGCSSAGTGSPSAPLTPRDGPRPWASLFQFCREMLIGQASGAAVPSAVAKSEGVLWSQQGSQTTLRLCSVGAGGGDEGGRGGGEEGKLLKKAGEAGTWTASIAPVAAPPHTSSCGFKKSPTHRASRVGGI